jgi:hypothetical protein
MNGRDIAGGFWGIAQGIVAWGAAACLATILLGGSTPALAQISTGERPSTAGHVPELARYLEEVQIAEPVVFRGLAVYPVLLRDGQRLRGGWMTLDQAVSRGVLVVSEKGGGSVPVVVVENRSRDQHVFIMTGEVISGGKQTRTVRTDVVLAPGQRIELSVFCVEAHRWQGGEKFSSANALVPQSIQQELRRGADQGRIWSEVARNNAALGAENATGSLDVALSARPVQEKLAEVRQNIVPKLPQGTMGFIFVDRGRALGAELFGREDLARALLPKLLDSYAVDCVLVRKAAPGEQGRTGGDRAAIEYFKRVCRAGSRRTDTPGSGAGIRTRGGGLLGDGVSLGGVVVHYGVQLQDRIVPLPKGTIGGPIVPLPERR